MKRRTPAIVWVMGSFLVLFALLCAGLLYFSQTAAAIGAGLWLAMLVSFLAVVLSDRRRVRDAARWFTQALDPQQKKTVEAFPLPAAAVSGTGELLLYNARFDEQFLGGSPAAGAKIGELFSGLDLGELEKRDSVDVSCGELRLTAYINRLPQDVAGTYVLYFVDNTALKKVAAEYTASRPVVLLINIDDLEEATHRLRDSERAGIAGQVEQILEEQITTPGGVLRKYGTDRFMAVIEDRLLSAMTRDRFAMLDRVRGCATGVDATVTISVGVGRGKTLQECETAARRALEMALARGGDQAAIKTAKGYDFYGGHSRGVERRTKVRTRILAGALCELIAESDQVFTMGHRLSDLDALGSAAALAVAARHLGREAHVIVRRGATMAQELIDRYTALGMSELFIEPDTALDAMTSHSLLIVTDVHSPALLDSREVYEQAVRVAVIDHHRKMVDHITDPALEYHEPSSSSASELVTELLQYMGDGTIGRPEAEALLAGITLDTRNFVLRTGVRTFEAAAYLRRLGADTVSVRRMFSDSLAMYRKKCELVSLASTYRGMAIAATDEDMADKRTAAAQAADEMLSIQGMLASFVVCRMGREVNISARSYGECNVQLIMESMGGGGHLTMAGTQIRDASVTEVERRLRRAIDEYIEREQGRNG